MRKIFKENITGLDVERGIAHYGFCEDSYRVILESFVKNTRMQLNDLKKISADGLASYATTVHGIKGAGRGIYAYKIDAEADALENAARAGDQEFVFANYKRFYDMIVKLLNNIDLALAKIGNEQKPIKNKPEREILIELLAACKNIDIDEIDAVMAKIESSEYTSDDGLAVWLRESLDRGAFNKIKERLADEIMEEAI
ncbi:MAG: hypothetical protein LBD23_17700 [Oscillospiraceae bacterium]|nr:hypothetical protein [Oscillospiraceae bacterium]